MARRRICFIDDSEAEIGRFRTYFGDRFDIVAGVDLDAAAAGGVAPDLFVLDLYFATSPSRQPVSESELREMLARLPDAASLYSGSEHEFLERVWAYLSGVRLIMDEVLAGFGQTADAGLDLMAGVGERFPGVPVVFYTRKGTLEDAVRCLAAGAADVIRKMQPRPGESEEAAMARAAPEIAGRFLSAMGGRSSR
jgi:DNA-binding NarL/FixJ family response regulator